MPSDAIAQRLSQGRFRVKSNVDLDTAERFAGELERLGAVVSVVDAASGQARARSAPAPTPPPAAAAPPSSSLAAAAPAASATAGNADDMETGLSAAFTGEAQTDMGLLSDGDSAAFSLATIDGDDDQLAAGPAAGPAGAAAAPGAPQSDDMFRPPDEGDPLDVAIDVAAAPLPPPPSPAAAGEPLIDLLADDPEAQMGGASAAEPAGNSFERVRTMLARSAGKRIAAGAVIAVLLGFVPALLVGAVRNGAYDTPRKKIEQAHQIYTSTPVATREDLAVLDATLDQQRSDQIAIMKDTQSSIALTAGIAWLLVSGGVGFFWFRKIDWDRWA